jgi:hypothetical protein
MRTRLAMTTACVVSAGLLFAAPWAHAESSTGTGTPVTAAARAAGVTLGQVAATSPANCSSAPSTPGPSTMAQYLEGGAPSYVTPSAGVITSYSVRASAAPGLARLVVFGPSATAGHRAVVGLSAQNAVVLNTVNTFATRVPVAAGLSIGLNNSADNMICWGGGVAGDQVAAAAPFDPAASADFPGGNPQTGKRVNISAVLEPDVDGDQYGDLTQDLCPQSSLTQAACPAPDTTVSKHPKKRSATRKARIRFASTIAGSTFTCAVDDKAAKPCASPFKKRVKVGKHTVVITATSAVGIVDPTPVTVKFKVTKPRK